MMMNVLTWGQLARIGLAFLVVLALAKQVFGDEAINAFKGYCFQKGAFNEFVSEVPLHADGQPMYHWTFRGEVGSQYAAIFNPRNGKYMIWHKEPDGRWCFVRGGIKPGQKT